MRTDKHVRMIIRSDGSCSVDAMNFTDATCQHVTQQIVQSLGGMPVNQRFKPEAQRLPPQADQQKEGAN